MNRLPTAAEAAIIAVSILILPSGSAAQVPPREEIVVTARRIGVPFWTVSGPATFIVLLPGDGTIPEGASGSVEALSATLRRADSIFYPGRTSISLSPFKMINYYLRWRRMSSLPKGLTVAALVGQADFERLTRLRERGFLKKDFNQTHPFPLSVELKRAAFGERRSQGKSVDQFVEEIAKKHAIRRVPVEKLRSKPVVKAFHETDAREYLPCLMATVDLVEAGQPAFRARAQAWRERRIRDVLSSPVDRAFELCIPPALRPIDRRDVRAQVRSLMSGRQVTVVVLPLISLASPNGVLDDLKASGYVIEGPDWR